MAFGRRLFGLRAAGLMLAAAGLPCLGCLGEGPTRRWLDPLGFAKPQAVEEQAEFRTRVDKDPFPNARQVGLAPSPKAETQD